jgi:mitochondrial fission protein ELM1
MGFMTTSRVISRLLPKSESEDALFLRERPERIVLDVDADVAASGKPPVRVYLGTEPGQQRAERVFIWSIEQVRDRSRRYEIYLMKDLAGFDRRMWLTGFTNYRFAIPHLAGGEGRAIYNDVDQIYLVDPAELFDTDMGEHGFLSITARDTSVMLIDCAKMKSGWSLEDTKHGGRRKAIEARARHLWGPLEREWNSRDWEYREGKSKVVHYTTIHAQPWQPFPDAFVYQYNPDGEIWHDLERSADAAGFQIFDLATPSMGFAKVVDILTATGTDEARSGMPAGRADTDEVLAIAARTGAERLFEFGFDIAGDDHPSVHAISPRRSGVTVTTYDPLARDSELPAGQFDGVVCTGALEHLTDDDIAWVLDDLFRRSRRFVHITVSQQRRVTLQSLMGRNRRSRREPAWWFALLRQTGARYPDVYWKIELTIAGWRGRERCYSRDGGYRLQGTPNAWLLVDHKPGHTTQSLGLVRALGWPYEMKPIAHTHLNLITDRIASPLLVDPDGTRHAMLAPPWPDVVISTGARTAPLSRWIAKQSRGATRTVQMGRKGGDVARHFDAVVTCSHLRLPMDDRRVETLAPLNRVTPGELEQAAERWPRLFGETPKPHIVLLVGGTSAEHRLDPQTATRMGDEVGRFAQQAGGTVLAVTSRRSGRDVEEALEAGLGASGCVDHWEASRHENPYLAYLALADAIVVTGDSESMLAEAVATGRPVYIYPVPTRPLGLYSRFAEMVTRIAYSRPKKAKGTVRPQQGREYLCARMIERAVVRPPRDLDVMCEQLVRHGHARWFGEPLASKQVKPLRENEEIASRVKDLLGWTHWDDPEATSAGESDSAKPRTTTASA